MSVKFAAPAATVREIPFAFVHVPLSYICTAAPLSLLAPVSANCGVLSFETALLAGLDIVHVQAAGVGATVSSTYATPVAVQAVKLP